MPKSMSNDRREFESWAVKREFDVSPNTTVFKEELPYADIETQSHFDAYEAGRKAGWQAHAENVAPFCQCDSPYLGAQPMGMPITCERCMKPVQKAESLSGAAPTVDDLYDAYLLGCEDECIPEPLPKEQFLLKHFAIKATTPPHICRQVDGKWECLKDLAAGKGITE